MGSIIDFYLDKVPKKDIVIFYKQDCDRFSLRSKLNSEEINEVSYYFKKRNFSELTRDEYNKKDNINEKKQSNAICLHVNDDLYEKFVFTVDELAKKRIKHIYSTSKNRKIGDGNWEDKLDSLIELLEFRRFVTRYYTVRNQKKYVNMCYYAILGND